MVYMDFWIKDWATRSENATLVIGNATTLLPLSAVEGSIPNFNLQDEFLLFYGVLGIAATIVSGIRSLTWVVSSLRAAKNLYHNMMTVILAAPMRFFDTTPTGRILSRAAEDTKQIDEQLPQFLRFSLDSLFLLIGACITIAIVIPYMLLPMIPFAITLVYVSMSFVIACLLAVLLTISALPHEYHFFRQTNVDFSSGSTQARVGKSNGSQLLRGHQCLITLDKRMMG